MALISCSDCGHQVSDRAKTCPKCSGPIAGMREPAAESAQLRTTQETSKKLKLHTLFSVSLILGAVFWLSVSPGARESGIPDPAPAWMFIVGMIWYLVNRLRIWWHHK